MDGPITGESVPIFKRDTGIHGERIWSEFLKGMGDKRSAVKFQGESWGSFKYLTSSSGREARKTSSCLLKDKKGRNC